MTTNWELNWNYPPQIHEPLTLPSTPAQVIYIDCLKRFTQRVHTIQDLESTGRIDLKKAYEGIRFSWEQLQQTRRDLGIVEDSAA